jgi:ATP-dependent Clp protease protease subunit
MSITATTKKKRLHEEEDQTDEEFHIDVIRNEIHFNGPVTMKSMAELVKSLYQLDAEIQAMTRAVKRKCSEIEEEEEAVFVKHTIKPSPIKLYLTSEGGLVYQALMVCDVIQRLETPVHTICTGFVASAATLISISGKKRYITEKAYMLIHEIRSGVWGKYTEIKEEHQNNKELMKDLVAFYLERTQLTEDFLKTILKKDRHWNAETCLEYGVVDKILYGTS